MGAGGADAGWLKIRIHPSITLASVPLRFYVPDASTLRFSSADGVCFRPSTLLAARASQSQEAISQPHRMHLTV